MSLEYLHVNRPDYLMVGTFVDALTEAVQTDRRLPTASHTPRPPVSHRQAYSMTTYMDAVEDRIPEDFYCGPRANPHAAFALQFIGISSAHDMGHLPPGDLTHQPSDCEFLFILWRGLLL